MQFNLTEAETFWKFTAHGGYDGAGASPTVSASSSMQNDSPEHLSEAKKMNGAASQSMKKIRMQKGPTKGPASGKAKKMQKAAGSKKKIVSPKSLALDFDSDSASSSMQSDGLGHLSGAKKMKGAASQSMKKTSMKKNMNKKKGAAAGKTWTMKTGGKPKTVKK